MTSRIAVAALAALLVTPWLQADILRLINGDSIEGTFLGGDARNIRFLDSEGNVGTHAIADVSRVEFGTSAPSASPPSAPQASAPPPARSRAAGPLRPEPAPSPGPAHARQESARAEIPAGAILTVRMIDAIDSNITDEGERFRASIDDPVTVDGRIVIPRGADATVQVVRVEQSGTLTGADEVGLKLYDVTVDGTAYDLTTNYAEVKGASQGKKTAKTTAVTTGVGAAIGAIIGGGKGAAIGAGAGAGTGVAVSAARGKSVRVPSETRLDFELRAPVTME